MSIITFIIIISVLVFIHELGHFLVAKKSGIRVDEFAVGFPPRIFSWKRGETTYSLNLIPFGGYVKIFGENPDENSLNGPDKARSFINKRRHVQAAVLVAGIVFNIIFAWMLFSGSFFFGVPSEASGPNANLYITSVVKDSPAEKSEVKNGDIILSIFNTGLNTKLEKPFSPEDVRDFITASKGKELEFSLSRNGDVFTKKISPKNNVTGENYAIGIQMLNISIAKYSFFESLWKGVETTWKSIVGTTLGLGKFFGNLFMAKADLSQVSGPVGIVSLVSEAKQFGFGFLLSFTALISINLAVINLVPFPALDGGRLLFVGIEAIRRKSISPKFLNALNLIGFGLLIILMIAITLSDVGRLIGK